MSWAIAARGEDVAAVGSNDGFYAWDVCVFSKVIGRTSRRVQSGKAMLLFVLVFHKNLDLFVDCLVLTRVINRTSRFQKTFLFFFTVV